MLATYPPAPHPPAWVDLFDASDAEQAAAAAATGLTVPTRDQLGEIESSSRLAVDGDVLRLSMPITSRDAAGVLSVTPLGLVLSPRHLLTVRFARLPAFESFAQDFSRGTAHSSVDAFVGLIEAMVDRIADVLEHVGAQLDDLSRLAFQVDAPGKHSPSRADRTLRNALRRIGLLGEHVSHIRDSLLGIGRIVPFVMETGHGWIGEAYATRLRTARQDIASLNDYDAQLSNKVQFLLDAILGFINIEQNNIIKILTVVSVVGIPPTLVASIYGMNFKSMPELQWDWGYPYGLSVIAASAVLPLVIFKIRGWL